MPAKSAPRSASPFTKAPAPCPPLAVPTIVISCDGVDIGQELERAVRIARTVDEVADREHTTGTTLREEDTCSLEDNVLAMDVPKDA